MENANAHLQNMVEDPEAGLVQRFRQGQDEAFVEIVEMYNEPVTALANRLIGWGGYAEDIAQDVFAAALMNRRKFKAKSSIKTWLFTITINKCRTWKYRDGLWQKFTKANSYRQDVHICNDDCLHERENYERVRKAVRRLPFKYRQVVVLKYLNEMDTSEILEILGISANTFNTQLMRARNLLKEYLDGIMEEK